MEPLVNLIRAYPEIGGLTPNDICALVLMQDQAAENMGRTDPWDTEQPMVAAPEGEPPF